LSTKTAAAAKSAPARYLHQRISAFKFRGELKSPASPLAVAAPSAATAALCPCVISGKANQYARQQQQHGQFRSRFHVGISMRLPAANPRVTVQNRMQATARKLDCE
jgi:hypothetical protein